jgi:hypothetical protein
MDFGLWGCFESFLKFEQVLKGTILVICEADSVFGNLYFSPYTGYLLQNTKFFKFGCPNFV